MCYFLLQTGPKWAGKRGGCLYPSPSAKSCICQCKQHFNNILQVYMGQPVTTMSQGTAPQTAQVVFYNPDALPETQTTCKLFNGHFPGKRFSFPSVCPQPMHPLVTHQNWHYCLTHVFNCFIVLHFKGFYDVFYCCKHGHLTCVQ